MSKKRSGHTSANEKDMNMQGRNEERKAQVQEDLVDTPEAEEIKQEQGPVDELERMKLELAEYKDKYLRSMAEFENYRRRSILEKADWIRHATKELALHICDVVDNFERALAQAKSEDLESPFGKGIVLIEKQLVNALQKEGVQKIEALGAEFDPEYHDALAHIPSEYEENMVAAIIQNGYTMHDKVIRPAKVAVSNGTKINTLEE